MLSIAGRAVGTIGRIPRQKKVSLNHEIWTLFAIKRYTRILSPYLRHAQELLRFYFFVTVCCTTERWIFFISCDPSLFVKFYRNEYVDVCIFLFYFFFCENIKIGRSIYDLRQFQNNSDTCAYAHFLYVTKCECVNLNKNIFIESYIKEGKIHFHPRKRFS